MFAFSARSDWSSGKAYTEFKSKSGENRYSPLSSWLTTMSMNTPVSRVLMNISTLPVDYSTHEYSIISSTHVYSCIHEYQTSRVSSPLRRGRTTKRTSQWTRGGFLLCAGPVSIITRDKWRVAGHQSKMTVLPFRSEMCPPLRYQTDAHLFSYRHVASM